MTVQLFVFVDGNGIKIVDGNPFKKRGLADAGLLFLK